MESILRLTEPLDKTAYIFAASYGDPKGTVSFNISLVDSNKRETTREVGTQFSSKYACDQRNTGIDLLAKAVQQAQTGGYVPVFNAVPYSARKNYQQAVVRGEITPQPRPLSSEEHFKLMNKLGVETRLAA